MRCSTLTARADLPCRATCRGFRASALSSLARVGRRSPAEHGRRGRADLLPRTCLVAIPFPAGVIDLDALADIRARVAAGLTPGQATVISTPRISKAAKACRIESCFLEPIPDPAHVHVPSTVAVNDRDRDTPEGQKIGKVFQQYE